MEITSAIHGIGTVLGFACAMISAALMLNLKNDGQRLKRAHNARRIAPVTWFAFIILIISGVILTLRTNEINFLMLGIKHLLVAILLVDALLIHFRYFPRYFRQLGTPQFSTTYATMRRIGTLSVTCWIIILVLSVLLGKVS
jgi:uncharacterized membrane protein